MSLSSACSSLLLAASLCWASTASAQLPPQQQQPQQPHAAVVMALSGQAKAIDAQGRERALEKGTPLYAGDRVVTADAALVQVRLNDGGYMSVRPNTEMVIDQFVYDEKDVFNSRFLVSLVRGGFRSITGLIGRKNPSGYQIRAATATIGIRGTDHEPVLVLDTPEAQAQAQSPPGLYDKVNDGETFITSHGGVLPLKRGDIGFAPLNTNLPPQVLLKIPDFYKIDLKTDARDPKDGTADGGKNTGGLLRPSVSARREALATTGNPNAVNNADTQGLGANAPAQPGAATGNATGTSTGTSTGTTGTTLTAEQRRLLGQVINNSGSSSSGNNTTTRADTAAPAPTSPRPAQMTAPAPTAPQQPPR